MKAVMKPSLPDVACETRSETDGRLDWVGMSQIELPIEVLDGEGHPVRVPTLADAFVNLIDPASKGIHMSRLYLRLDQFSMDGPVTVERLRKLLADFIHSHDGLSDRAHVALRFDYYERRSSLISDNSGWKHYPAEIRAQLTPDGFICELGVEIPYSSTCPCSAALSRQLIMERFAERFAGQQQIPLEEALAWLATPEGVNATPHSQRSIAQIRVRLQPGEEINLSALISLIEGALQTPVQAAVKREDEQEFARLNAANLMFCEDAARRLQAALEAVENRFADFWARVNHYESLHPHDAVAVTTKGLPNGYPNDPEWVCKR